MKLPPAPLFYCQKSPLTPQLRSKRKSVSQWSVAEGGASKESNGGAIGQGTWSGPISNSNPAPFYLPSHLPLTPSAKAGGEGDPLLPMAASRPWPPTSAISPDLTATPDRIQARPSPSSEAQVLSFCSLLLCSLVLGFALLGLVLLWVYEGCPFLCALMDEQRVRWAMGLVPRGLVFLVRLEGESPNLSCRDLASSEKFQWVLKFSFITHLARLNLSYHSWSIWQSVCLMFISWSRNFHPKKVHFSCL